MPTEIARLWLENPMQGDPGQAVAQATQEEAEARRTALRTVMTAFYADWVPLVTKAYVHRDWVALGYEAGLAGWETYCRENFHPDVLLPRETRTRMIEGLHFAGMSQRAIGAAVGTSARTVGTEVKGLRQNAADGPDATILSLDGRRRPATKPAEVEPEGAYVPPREREFPEVETAPPVVFSGTPGGATAEAPDVAQVDYAGWLSMAGVALRSARESLAGMTGEFTQPGDFAARADDQLMSEIDRLARSLHAFVADVWALRGRWVWMSAERAGLDWHELGDDEAVRCAGAEAVDDVRPWNTLCGRTTAGGVAMSESRAVRAFGARPCVACRAAGKTADTAPAEPEQVDEMGPDQECRFCIRPGEYEPDLCTCMEPWTSRRRAIAQDSGCPS